jgi:hypothetical protein
MRLRALSLVVSLALIAAACGIGTAGTGTNTSRNTITRQQMIDVGATTVYDAVQKIQPSWLTSRGPRSLTDDAGTVPSVFIAGNQVGDVEYLRNLRLDDVDQLRWYAPGEAGARFGMGHPRGVIEVVMRRKP